MLLKLARRLICAHHRRSVTAAPQRGVAVLVNCISDRAKVLGLACRSRMKHVHCQTSSACLNRRNTHSRGFYTIACYENMDVIETAFDIARVGILTSSRWGAGAMTCTSTEGAQGKTA